MQKWEYLEITRVEDENWKVNQIEGQVVFPKPKPDFFPYVQELGQQGWELVSVQDTHFYFKRPIE